MVESNTVVGAYRMYRHLQQYCSQPSILNDNITLKRIMGKEENTGYQHFLISPTMFFKQSLSPGSLKLGIVWQRVNAIMCCF